MQLLPGHRKKGPPRKEHGIRATNPQLQINPNLDLMDSVCIIIITQGLHLIDGFLSALNWATVKRISVRDMDDGLALNMLYVPSPCLPVLFTSDKESDQHARVHLADMNATQSRRMTRANLFLRIVISIFVVRERTSRVMRIKVKQEGTLSTDEIMGG